MKIGLIAPILFDLGLYTISPQLKARNHSVKLLFIPELMQNCSRPLSNKTMSRICEFVRSSDLIGINGSSENYHKTASLVNYIKQSMDIPLIWGGIYATLSPKDCLRHADMVCVGEGEEAMVELVDKLEAGERVEPIKNILFHSHKHNADTVKLRPPVNLDSLLPFDYDLNSQYILEKNLIRRINEHDFRGTFLTYSSRGCPFRCSYCCNAFMMDSYREYSYYRQRNIENVISELKIIKGRFSSCKSIWFNEADFLVGKTQNDIERFAESYKEKINIPFSIWTNPASINDNNIRILKKAGFRGTNIGTVNANSEIQKEIYHRSATVKLYREKAQILNNYNINVEYDLILCNPYENDNQIINTIHLLMSLPKPFRIIIYNLTYFPKTELYTRALKDGIIHEQDQTQSYTKAAYKTWKFHNKNAYVNVVASLMRGMARKDALSGIYWYGLLPEPILKFLIKRPVVIFFNHLPFQSFFFALISNCIRIGYTIYQKIFRLFKYKINIL